MGNKGWAIFISSLYILYLITIFPWYLIFILLSNAVKRSFNRMIIDKELRKQGVPKVIRKTAKKQYTKSFKILTIKNGIKLMKMNRNQKNLERKNIDDNVVLLPN